MRSVQWAFGFMFLAACQMAEYKGNERSPHLPVFAEITKEAYVSNPYWMRGEVFYDQQKIKLNTGKSHFPTAPSVQASIGTHYRFKNNLYIYAMTLGFGIQYDSHIWEKSKLSWGVLAGTNQNYGVQVSYAQAFTKFLNGELTGFVSLQRRSSVTVVWCDDLTNTSCAGDGTLGENRAQIAEDVFNFLLGLQGGQFQLGSKGHTTVSFRLELGTQNVLSRRTLTEWYPSDYENILSFPLLAITGELTLW